METSEDFQNEDKCEEEKKLARQDFFFLFWKILSVQILIFFANCCSIFQALSKRIPLTLSARKQDLFCISEWVYKTKQEEEERKEESL